MRLAAIPILLLCLATLPGCLLVAGAAVGAGALIVTADDTVEVLIERDVRTVYEAALAELDARGTSMNRNPEFRRCEGEIGGSHVWIEVSPDKHDATRLRVRARKLEGTLPDLDLARDITNATVDEIFRATRDSEE